MYTHLFQQPDWFHAVNLSERVSHLNHTAFLEAKLETLAVDERAVQQFDKWKNQMPFKTNGYFQDRLSLAKVSEAELLYLLAEPVAQLQSRLPKPDWLQEIEEAFDTYTTLSLTEEEQKHYGFLALVWPLVKKASVDIEQAMVRLQKQYQPQFLDIALTQAQLMSDLRYQILEIVNRTLVLELNVARLRKQLNGETAQDRFQSFVQLLTKPEFSLPILQEYSVMARQVVIRIKQWLNFHTEWLTQLCQDLPVILENFAITQAPGTLVEASRAGDKHCDARAVLILKFESGLKLVYKPHSLAVDTAFQALLTWINSKGQSPALKPIQVLDRGSYGWVEFVEGSECSSTDEVARFYQRQGSYLALLYALDATDFHFENLIAAGEHPILIDLESLFQARPPARLDLPNASAGLSLNGSVLRIGLLPQRYFMGGDSEGVDMSGLGAQADMLTPMPVPTWDNPGTDVMRLKKMRLPMGNGQNRPKVNGTFINVEAYATDIQQGFTHTYALLMRHKEEMLAPTGPIAAFADVEVRYIPRATNLYSKLLYESYHPDMLRNNLVRERFLDKLWLQVEVRPYLAQIIESEQIDMHHGDVPHFVTRPLSVDIWDARGLRIENLFEQSGLELVYERLQKLNPEDLARQLWFIEASFTSLSLSDGHASWPFQTFAPPTEGAATQALLTAARQVGDRLQFLALEDSGGVGWIGLTLANEKHWMLSPMGADLYSGTGGIALFLAYLGEITQEEGYTKLAKQALQNMLAQLDFIKGKTNAIGGFSGYGSIIYTLTHLAALWQQPDLLDHAEALIDYLEELVPKDTQYDIIGGSAGTLLGLVALYQVRPSARVLAAALLCGEHLLQEAEIQPRGIGWPKKEIQEPALAGFSHGAAGVAAALLALHQIQPDARYLAAAQNAFTYERSLFSEEAQNWPDLRQPTDEREKEIEVERFMLAWCHGAPGVGLGRLKVLDVLRDAAIEAEIATAVRTTQQIGFGHNHSLCHGDLGNLEFLLLASEKLMDSALQDHTYRVAAGILQSIERNGWLCGVPNGVETPGLMTGITGIGYELLRLAAPARVPSLLIMEPPRGRFS